MSTPPIVVLGEAIPDDWLDSRVAEQHDLRVGLSAVHANERPRVVGLLTTLNTRIDARVVEQFPKLRCVSNMAVGYDNIDVSACAARSIPVGHTPGVLTDATADLCWALILACARGIVPAASDARHGRWGQWTPTGWLGRDLRGARLGIVGFGAIGQAVAQRGRAFRMEMVYANRSPRTEAALALDARALSLEELLTSADIVSLHLPLTDATRGLIDGAALARMQRHALLINTARGDIVDQPALLRALQSHQIAGAGLDVTSPEPLPPDHPLFSTANCLITPHIGSAAEGTRRAMAQLACENLLAGLQGLPLPKLVPELA